MKNLILSFSLLSSFALNAGECSRPDTSDEFESPIAYMEDSYYDNIEIGEYFDRDISEKFKKLKSYDKKLNEYLANSEDIKIQLSSVNSFYYSPISNAKTKSILKKAINLRSDKHTIYLADNICHTDKELSQWCHKQNIHQIHYKIDPENVSTYLSNLHTDDSTEHINNTIQLAADMGFYSNIFYYDYIIELAEKLGQFNALNPIVYSDFMQINDSEDEIKEMNQTVTNLQLIEKGLIPENYSDNYSESTAIIYAIGKEMAKIQSFGNLAKYCEEIDNAEACIDIAKLLMEDKTIINQMIGTSIYKKSLAILNYPQEQDITDNTNKTYAALTCYTLPEDVMYSQLLNKDFMLKYIQDAKKSGEAYAAKQMALKIYNIEKQHGFNPDFNPNECE